jgi:hypothetical protein
MHMRVKERNRKFISARFHRRTYLNLRQIVTSCIILLLLLISLLSFSYRTTHASPPCPCTVFTSSQPSVTPSLFTQPGTIELGFKFQSDQGGFISGIRFYKVSGMTGTHTASLWNQYGTRVAQATFTSESPTGWQEVNFSPVAITAHTTYTASVYMADGNYPATSNYFTADIINSPLSAAKSGSALDGSGNTGQGVYDDSGSSVYPIKSFNAANYWIDVSYTGSATATPPVVSSVTPLQNTTNVAVTDALTATFNAALDPTTIGANSLVLKDNNNVIVPGTTTYDSTTYTIKFVPTNLLQTAMTYTATLSSGSTGITDLQGRHLAVDTVWSFSTSSNGLVCPCSMQNRHAPDGSFSARDTYPSGLELGLKVVPTTNGYITALRFYKTIITPDTSHSGHIWDANGNSLASVTFNNESDYGWQEATLATPVNVIKDQVYIISYGMATSYYQVNSVFNAPILSPGLAAYPAGDSRNATTISGTANSVYATTPGTYPTQSSTSYYYVDAVFAKQASDSTPLNIVNTQPTDKSYGVSHTILPSISFDQALDSSTINNTTVNVYDSNHSIVNGTIAYDVTKHAITFSPASPFGYNATYTVHISAQIKDARGYNLSSDYSWSFTTGSALKTDMNQGNGGPILVVTTGANPYGNYYAEILQTEGFNYFDVKDITTLSSAMLANYTTVLLTSMSVTQTQVDMFSAWVNNGGNLVTMRPDKKFASLLGLNDTGLTSTNQYLRTNVASSAGIGIVDTTIQYKGTADRYNTAGADVVATLYSDSTTATSYPAATTRSIGSGTAMAFTYDLAQSVIGLHQGNQAWSGQDRNGDAVIRSNDLFYGQAAGDPQPDWLDSSKIDIPQADEQQRLLANMITAAMKKNLPAPRFWYLPNMQKTALVLAGDDHKNHNNTGTEQTINNWLNDSLTGCSVIDWQCVRASHYVYSSGELTQSRAYQYSSYGFEIGNHPSNSDTCNTFLTFGAVASKYASELLTWQTQYPNLPPQQTIRFHCYLWNSWDWMPQADLLNNIHYDLNTVAYPSSWIGTHSPIVTGSGMNMRLTDASGALLNVHQGVTNFDNTTANATSIAAAFDNALGSDGYYGVFGSHYDMNDTYDKTLYSVATSRNIPIISSQQALDWWSGRESSNFSHLMSSAPGEESFTITTGEGTHGLQAMVPLNDAHGTITNISLAAKPITYQTNVIKGVQYALFNAVPGDYVVTYSDSPTSSSLINQPTGPQATSIHNGSNIVISPAAQTADTAVSQTPSLPNASPLPSQEVSNQRIKNNEGITVLQIVLIVGVGIAVVGGGCAIWFLVIRPRLLQ